jgi:hypothetical protein
LHDLDIDVSSEAETKSDYESSIDGGLRGLSDLERLVRLRKLETLDIEMKTEMNKEKINEKQRDNRRINDGGVDSYVDVNEDTHQNKSDKWEEIKMNWLG